MQQSLRYGHSGEKFVKTIFESADIEVNFNDDSSQRDYYDLICKLGRTCFTTEVKFDMMAQKTGNIAIEYYNCKSCKDSGINVTKADIWAQVLQDGSNLTLWVSRVDELKSFIEKVKPWRNLTGVGDDNACIYLYKDFDILETQLVRLDNINSKQVKKILKGMLK